MTNKLDRSGDSTSENTPALARAREALLTICAVCEYRRDLPSAIEINAKAALAALSEPAPSGAQPVEIAAMISTRPEFSMVESPLILDIVQATLELTHPPRTPSAEWVRALSDPDAECWRRAISEWIPNNESLLDDMEDRARELMRG